MMPGIVCHPLWLGLHPDRGDRLRRRAVDRLPPAPWQPAHRPGPRRRRPGDGLRHRRHALHRDGRRAVPLGSFGAAGRGIDNGWLAVLVIVITLAVIAIALIVSVLDSRLEARTSVLATSHEPTAS